MEKHIEQLMGAIDDLVSGDDPWSEKKAAIENYCSKSDRLKTSLEEFLSWWSE